MPLHLITARSLGESGGISHVMEVHRIGNLTICAGCFHHNSRLNFPKWKRIDGKLWPLFVLSVLDSCEIGGEPFGVMLGSIPSVVAVCDRGIFGRVATNDSAYENRELPQGGFGVPQNVQVKSSAESQIETKS